MAIIYPTDCNTWYEKAGFCMEILQVLKCMRNAFGRWYRQGLTADEYDILVDCVSHYIKVCENPGANLSVIIAAVIAKYPYKAQLTLAEWNAFVKDDYDPRKEEVYVLEGNIKIEIRKAYKWTKLLTDLKI